MSRSLFGALGLVFVATFAACSSGAVADSSAGDEQGDDDDDDDDSTNRPDAGGRDADTPRSDAGTGEGECAIDCQGGACEGGVCQPVVLRTGFYASSWALAASGAVYYTNTDGYVFRLGETEADDEAIGDEPVDRIVAADDDVIWAAKDQTVVTLPVDGGTPEVRVEATEDLPPLAVNSSHVFWAGVSHSQKLTVQSSAIDAATPYVGVTWPEQLVADGFSVADDEHLYYRGGSSARSNFHRVGLDGTGDEVVLEDVALSNVQIVDDELYFIAFETEVGDTVLEHAQLDGSGRARIWEGVFGAAGAGAYYNGSFLVTPHAIYWAKGKTSELVRLAR